jgi:hypothetical protein
MMARRSGQPGLESRFVSVIVPYQKSCFVEKIEEIELKPINTMAVCLKVTLSDGRVDYILSAPEPNQQYKAVDGAIRITFQGQYGMVRTRDGKVENQSLFNGTRLSCNQNSIHLDKPSLSGKIISIDNNAKTITLDIPAGQQDLAGRVAMIRTGDSPRNAAYTIQESKDDHGKLVLKLQSLDFVLAEGLLDKDSKGTSNESKVPVPYAYTYDTQTHYFDGCLIKNLRTGEVVRASTFKTMQNFELVRHVAGNLEMLLRFWSLVWVIR